MRHTSKAGVAMIARFEGFRATPYNDAAVPPNATIGFGHKIHDGPVTAADRATWGTISEARGRELLASDLLNAERAVNTLVVPPFRFQHRFDAVVSLVFNIGTGAFSTSHLLELLNATRVRRGAADEFLHWRYAGGKPILLPRRQVERRTFLYGLYR